MRLDLTSYILCCTLILACSSDRARLPNAQQPANEKRVSSQDSIRSVDFNGISYPRYRDLNGNHITTKPGQYSPAFVEYGDVTTDRDEDAIVVLPVATQGTAIPHNIYIFSVLDGKLILLADIETCDRADGGLRRVFAEDGKLVLELYGKGKILGSDLCADDGTRKEIPYPYAITRSRYAWENGRFI